MLAGMADVAADYTHRAEAIRSAVLAQLWNPTLQHFTDRYQRSTKYVTAGEFIRGRELVGYVPWFYELPPKGTLDAVEYAAAWRHILSAKELSGPYGLRTVEPSYPRYLAQYRYDQPTKQPECQWNGPSWPFETSQALTGLANLLNDYTQTVITRADYLRLLRQYTHQHFLSAGHSDLQEDYNPDTGAPIVGLARSHHYNHSTYIDLVLSGLIGIRPRADDVLEINPLLPTENSPQERPIHYFALEGLVYHGHDIGVVYDADGTRYNIGRGLTVFVDGKRAAGPSPLGRLQITLPVANRPAPKSIAVDLAANPGLPGAPIAAASSSISSEAVTEAIDGRLWFFAENPNGWSPAAEEANRTSWYSVDFGQSRKVASVELYFFADDALYKVPRNYTVQYRTENGWQDIREQKYAPQNPLANGRNKVTFPPVDSTAIRVIFQGPAAPASFRLIEVKAF
jgi:hypothetical protein